jgi:hypothetical protein
MYFTTICTIWRNKEQQPRTLQNNESRAETKEKRIFRSNIRKMYLKKDKRTNREESMSQ